ncbi:MAG: TolC family protein [Desulforegulaceae bacterium]|nr:TolC family protein [Desulforegulaceae bacterium]
MNQKFLIFVLIIILISGCASFKPEEKNFDVKMPESFTKNLSGNVKIEKWWEDLNNEELNYLVETALKNNNTIKKAFETLKKSGAVSAKEKSGLFPDLDIEGGISETRTDKNTSKSSSARLAASYEIDLWGKINSRVKAAEFNEKAARSELESAAVTIASETVTTWKDITSINSRLKILNEILNQNENQLEILKLRYKNGMTKASNIYDHKKETISLKETINSIELEKTLLLNKLIYLTGIDSLKLKVSELPDLPPMPETGIPLDILSSRPDIKASFSRLNASQQNLYSAKKNMLPKLSISGAIGLGSDDFSLSIDDWISNLAANLAAPVFNGGNLKEEIKRTRAERNENLYSYKDLVISALKEVSDAVSEEKSQLKKLELVKKRIEASKTSLYYSENEYKNGSSDYIDYIEKYNYLKNLESILINEKSNLLEYRISLYRAIGSTWAEKFAKNMENKNE